MFQNYKFDCTSFENPTEEKLEHILFNPKSPEVKSILYTVNNLLCGRNVNEILRVLRSIQYVKENPGQICPFE